MTQTTEPPTAQPPGPQTTQFTIGVEATCTDGVTGKVSRVVVDPLAQTVTHLVVEPAHREGEGRLVPLALVDSTTDGIRLRCSSADFEKLDRAEETHFETESTVYPGYGPGQAMFWPYYGLGAGMGTGLGVGGPHMAVGTGSAMGSLEQPVTTDTLPTGEIGVRRGQRVCAVDGDIGKVQGLVVDTRDHRMTHVLLQEGHLFGRKQVAIPISAVTDVTDGIRLSLTKQQVEDLPAVDVDRATR